MAVKSSQSFRSTYETQCRCPEVEHADAAFAPARADRSSQPLGCEQSRNDATCQSDHRPVGCGQASRRRTPSIPVKHGLATLPQRLIEDSTMPVTGNVRGRMLGTAVAATS